MNYPLGVKLFIDRMLFGTMCILLNLAARIIAIFHKRDHAADASNVKVIIICKYIGMGSIVRSTVMLRDLRESFPNAKIIYVTKRSNLPLLDLIPGLDGVMTIDDGGVLSMLTTTTALVYRMIRMKVDLYFDLEVYSRFSSAVSLMSMSRNRYGLFREITNFKKGIYTHLFYFNVFKNITDIYLLMAKQATGRINNRDMLQMSIPERYAIEADALIRSFVKQADNGTRPLLVGINPNASELAFERRYPAIGFVKVIEALVECRQREIWIMLIGAPSEAVYMETEIASVLKGKARARLLNAAGKLSFGGSMALISKFDILITNDSGPMHFAFNLGVPTVSLWGPCSHTHYRLENLDYKSAIIYQDIYCSPCVHQTDIVICRGDNICMKTIQPRKIAEESFRLLGIEGEHVELNTMVLPSSYSTGSVILR